MKVISQQTWKSLFSYPYSSQSSQSQTISLTLNQWIGDPIQTANDWAKAWASKFERITDGIPDTPPLPKQSELKPGWNKYDGYWQPSGVPDGTIVFDTETHGQYHQFPILGIAVNPRHWFIWVSEWALGGRFDGSLIELNPESLVIAHNAAFDIGRVANSYRGDNPHWLDTMSLVQATNGLPRKIVNLFQKKKVKPGWFYRGTGVSLKDAVTFWVDGNIAKVTQEDKEIRGFFAECDISTEKQDSLRENWHKLVGYALNDVWATYHLFRCILPPYLETCPNLTSLMAQSLLLTARFPINPDFEDWKEFCDLEFKARNERIEEIITKLIADTEYQADCPWLSKLNWNTTTRGKYAGIPEWKKPKNKITLRSRSLPYLLKLSWNGNPLQHSKELGWHYLDGGEPVRLPHKLGEGNNVGNPLADVYRTYIEDGTLRSEIPGFDLKEFHRLYFETTYWVGNRDRIGEIFVKNGIHVPSIVPHRTVTRRSGDNLWLTVPDTKEGKIGTAIKSQIRVSEPYKLVGSDFATQELNIAALISDWYTSRELGSNDFSYSIFAGRKEDGTDLHSALANRFGIPRSVAKSLNFAGLYNCGSNRYATVLKQEGVPKANSLANEILVSKRGQRLPVLSPLWLYSYAILSVANTSAWLEVAIDFYRLGAKKIQNSDWLSVGGTDSWYYNAVSARLSESQPRTPLLDCRMPKWLEVANQRGDEFMTAANWVIQSTGVDILSLFLVLMDWLRYQRNLGFSYVVSRHDEIWYLCHESEVNELAECMQIAHLSCWAALANKLGINCLPESLCLFPEINVDTVLRKEVDLPVWDGFGSQPEEGYYIKADRFKLDPQN